MKARMRCQNQSSRAIILSLTTVFLVVLPGVDGSVRSKRMLAPHTSSKAPMPSTTPKQTTAFMKALQPSAALAAIVGSEPLPRTEVTKRLWDYIKAHNLQNPQNKRNILCDGPLKAVMGKDEVTMFEMTGLVGKHLAPT